MESRPNKSLQATRDGRFRSAFAVDADVARQFGQYPPLQPRPRQVERLPAEHRLLLLRQLVFVAGNDTIKPVDFQHLGLGQFLFG